MDAFGNELHHLALCRQSDWKPWTQSSDAFRQRIKDGMLRCETCRLRQRPFRQSSDFGCLIAPEVRKAASQTLRDRDEPRERAAAAPNSIGFECLERFCLPRARHHVQVNVCDIICAGCCCCCRK